MEITWPRYNLIFIIITCIMMHYTYYMYFTLILHQCYIIFTWILHPRCKSEGNTARLHEKVVTPISRNGGTDYVLTHNLFYYMVFS